MSFLRNPRTNYTPYENNVLTWSKRGEQYIAMHPRAQREIIVYEENGLWRTSAESLTREEFYTRADALFAVAMHFSDSLPNGSRQLKDVDSTSRANTILRLMTSSSSTTEDSCTIPMSHPVIFGPTGQREDDYETASAASKSSWQHVGFASGSQERSPIPRAIYETTTVTATAVPEIQTPRQQGINQPWDLWSPPLSTFSSEIGDGQ